MALNKSSTFFTQKLTSRVKRSRSRGGPTSYPLKVFELGNVHNKLFIKVYMLYVCCYLSVVMTTKLPPKQQKI